jgi:4-alpha-glucanotransferase
VKPSTDLVRAALALLGKDRFVLNLHDASFPSARDEDIGRGSPYARGGVAFLDFARRLGFDSLLLGPQGLTSAVNRSPYDGTFFSRNVLSIDLGALVREGLVRAETLADLVRRRPGTGREVKYATAVRSMECALDEAFATVEASPARFGELRARVTEFRNANRDWIDRDALFDALSREHGTDDPHRWPPLDAALFDRATPDDVRRDRISAVQARHHRAIDRYIFAQAIVHEQHARWRASAARGITLYGDLQVGASPVDRWTHPNVFLREYVMGAPPSRTTQAGQPWGYGVLDPDACAPRDPNGDAERFLRMRLAKNLGEYDGLRIDHPHGLVCPWVYRADDPDPASAVRRGARLFESPDLEDHPRLARYARVSPWQIDRTLNRWDDAWVHSLTESQIAVYGAQVESVLAAARAAGRSPSDVLFEVLSTCPAPLAAVLDRHDVGRFRVTQKARLDDPRDVYRSENAAPTDWIMVGTHDTEPLALVVRRWTMRGEIDARAAYLSERLARSEGERATMRATIAKDPRMCMRAMFADLFASPARHVIVFFADLFALDEVFNVPGEINATNWNLRVPPDYQLAMTHAIDIGGALAAALRARGLDESLARRLEEGFAP